MMYTYIPERFEKVVVLHALRISWLRHKDAPLLMGIHGLPGEGKTFQCKIVLEKNGFKVFQISGGSLESKNAGEPARIVREQYEQAQKFCAESDVNKAAIIIDDADAAFGNWGELFQYTVNTQNLLAELMNIADYNANNQKEIRIPIYLTGNDFTKIYGPLKRAGRMETFHWAPTDEERLKYIYFEFEMLDLEECKELLEFTKTKIEGIGNLSTAFFSDIKTCIYDDYIWNQYISSRDTSLTGSVISGMGLIDKYPEVSLEMIKEKVKLKIEELEKTNHGYVN